MALEASGESYIICLAPQFPIAGIWICLSSNMHSFSFFLPLRIVKVGLRVLLNKKQYLLLELTENAIAKEQITMFITFHMHWLYILCTSFFYIKMSCCNVFREDCFIWTSTASNNQLN